MYYTVLASILGLAVTALGYPNDLNKRAISYVTDLPEDAYKEDDKVTIIIAATIGGVAGLVLLSCLVFAIIRRKKRGPRTKKQEDEAPQPVHEANMREPSGPIFSEQEHYPSAPQLARHYRQSMANMTQNHQPEQAGMPQLDANQPPQN
ncbi:hypothetical protein LPJ55_005515 [Coemansia sp. RSA 990]|nr:hypothetical protein LPJ68_004667 [Coemansia sp. RSA 1086]KAJ1748456.1 hypothetical protein LPJ79_004516 [Coemansia sp. RSA 1821]KAJ1869202.1 hypothetical protein LPJ55_005515 [Coemansia sp. RSA 990]KAJ2646438.1 hypothetical protein IWW40_005431 [Coemansia sp. RSA 1250]KAJ2668182.1 hypothetical protein IWW42_005384 [Coemansia sp. RSA 1085]